MPHNPPPKIKKSTVLISAAAQRAAQFAQQSNAAPFDAALLSKAQNEFAFQTQRESAFIERYGHARIPVCCRFEGKWMVAVGSSLYRQTQDGPYDFTNVLHDHALLFFGEPFMEAEERKPLARRHPAMQWMHTYVSHRQRVLREQNPDPRGSQIGSGAAWFRLAYDLFTIGDNSKLERMLKARLLDPQYFQAARHELKVAAMCIGAGFSLDFEDEQDNSRRHPEFIATDRFSSTKIAVEVKSRHRKGIQGFNGGRDIAPGDKVDIRKPLLEAYKKNVDLPFYVFIDTNLPPAEDESIWNRWIAEIRDTMIDLDAEGYADSCPANAIFFSNDPSHYLAEQQIGNDADRLWITYYAAKSPRAPHPEQDIVFRLMRAHEQRLCPPADLNEFVAR
ncbi:hypothetical protein [Burkholderia latens]|uniref:hypothetical protein n=1 Tax=Burkholderia latens TaxID=488446 RepID=UPI001588E2D8|nr:hypothetical protein [Burkholderia latens]